MQVLDGVDLSDASLAAAALVQVPYVMRNASGRLQRAAVAQHPLFGSLMQAALRAVPDANMRVYSFPWPCTFSFHYCKSSVLQCAQFVSARDAIYIGHQ